MTIGQKDRFVQLQQLTFRFRFVTTFISKVDFMKMDFDYLNYLTSPN